MNSNYRDLKKNISSLVDNLEKVILGKRDTILLVIIGLLCKGHILIEDVPGVGKTVLARGVAKSLGVKFSRIQFTPDMLPSDVTGVSIYNQGSNNFEFRPGPILANIVLADEINRATPKTQSALLESMEEQQVTVDGKTYKIDKPFLVIATQNPIEYEGTFPLPEAQLDRFLLRLNLGYPKKEDEIRILESQRVAHPISRIEPVLSKDDIVKMQSLITSVYVSDQIKKYIIDIIDATRNNPDVYLGASPRGSLGLFKSSQALAAISNREYVIPDDVKKIFGFVLSHRIILNPSARIKDITPNYILNEIVSKIPVPGGIYRKY